MGKRAQNDLCDHQTKILPISQHCGLAMSGLTADGRSLCNFMRQECLNEDFVYSRNMELGRLLAIVGDKMQSPTQTYGRRPYGVGLLVAGYDESGPHIYETCPSANYFDCKAMAIGARSQSARTYLERHLDEFANVTRDELIRHALRALRDTLPNDVELTNKNCSIAVVGKNEKLQIYDDDDVSPFLEGLDQEERRGGAVVPQEEPEPAADGAAPSDSADAPPAQGDQMDTD